MSNDVEIGFDSGDVPTTTSASPLTKGMDTSRSGATTKTFTIGPNGGDVDDVDVDGGGGKTYLGPSITRKDSGSSGSYSKLSRFPIFLDGRGNVYDKFYLPLDEDGYRISREDKSDPTMRDLASNRYDPFSPLWISFPNAMEKRISSYVDYEQACADWKKNVEENIGYLELPRTIGRKYFRPRVLSHTLMVERSDSTSSSTAPSLDSAGSIPTIGSSVVENVTSIGSVFDDGSVGSVGSVGSDRDDDGTLPSYTLSHDPWESVLVSPEPNPLFYDTYDDYAFAMKRWMYANCKRMSFIPPHPGQLQQLLGISTAIEREQRELQRHSTSNHHRDASRKNSDLHASYHREDDMRVRTSTLDAPMDMAYDSFVRFWYHRSRYPAVISGASSHGGGGDDDDDDGDDDGGGGDLVIPHRRGGGVAHTWRHMAKEDRRAIRKIFRRALKKRMANRDEGGNFTAPLERIRHPTYKPQYWRDDPVLPPDPPSILKLRPLYALEGNYGASMKQRTTPTSSSKASPESRRAASAFPGVELVSSSKSIPEELRKRGNVNEAHHRRRSRGGSGIRRQRPSNKSDTKLVEHPEAIQVKHVVDDLIPVDLSRLDEYEYSMLLRDELDCLSRRSEHDDIYSWSHPFITDDVHSNHVLEMDDILIQLHHHDDSERSNDSLVNGVIRRLLIHTCLLDRFEDFLDRPCSFHSKNTTNMEAILSVLSPKLLFHHSGILSLMRDSACTLVHAKLAKLIALILQSTIAWDVIHYACSRPPDRLEEHARLRGLYDITQCLVMFDESSSDVWPYHPDVQYSILGQHASELRLLPALVHEFFVYYYLSLMGNVFKNQRYVYMGIIKQLEDRQRKAELSMSDMLIAPRVFDHVITIGIIQSRARVEASFWLFFLIQLMTRCTCGSLQITLRKPELALVSRIRHLARSRFSHAQFAAARLMAVLQQGFTNGVDDDDDDELSPQRNDVGAMKNRKKKEEVGKLTRAWSHYLFSYYNNHPGMIEQDICEPPISLIGGKSSSLSSSGSMLSSHHGVGTPNSIVGASSSPLSLLALDVCINASRDALFQECSEEAMEPYRFLLNHRLFSLLLGKILDHPSHYRVNVKMSHCLWGIARAMGHFGLINVTKDTAFDFKHTTDGLSIQPKVIVGMIKHIMHHNGGRDDDGNSKRYLLRCIGTLLSQEKVYSSIGRNELLHQMLSGQCRRALHWSLNEEAWKVFFRLAYRYEGHLEFLESSGLLTSYLDILAPTGKPIAVANGLLTLQKLLSMERMATKQHIVPPRDPRTYRKDVKLIAQATFSRSTFVKLHMVFKSAGEGLVQQRLMELFHEVEQHHPNIMKALKGDKSKQYREGIVQLSSMYQCHFKYDE